MEKSLLLQILLILGQGAKFLSAYPLSFQHGGFAKPGLSLLVGPPRNLMLLQMANNHNNINSYHTAVPVTFSQIGAKIMDTNKVLSNDLQALSAPFVLSNTAIVPAGSVVQLPPAASANRFLFDSSTLNPLTTTILPDGTLAPVGATGGLPVTNSLPNFASCALAGLANNLCCALIGVLSPCSLALLNNAGAGGGITPGLGSLATLPTGFPISNIGNLGGVGGCPCSGLNNLLQPPQLPTQSCCNNILILPFIPDSSAVATVPETVSGASQVVQNSPVSLTESVIPTSTGTQLVTGGSPLPVENPVSSVVGGLTHGVVFS